jgi:hypothetical protein
MRFIDSRSPTNPLAAIGGDLRASLAVEPTLPDAINRLTAALERAETGMPDARQKQRQSAAGGGTRSAFVAAGSVLRN